MSQIDRVSPKCWFQTSCVQMARVQSKGMQRLGDCYCQNESLIGVSSKDLGEELGSTRTVPAGRLHIHMPIYIYAKHTHTHSFLSLTHTHTHTHTEIRMFIYIYIYYIIYTYIYRNMGEGRFVSKFGLFCQQMCFVVFCGVLRVFCDVLRVFCVLRCFASVLQHFHKTHKKDPKNIEKHWKTKKTHNTLVYCGRFSRAKNFDCIAQNTFHKTSAKHRKTHTAKHRKTVTKRVL